MSEQNKYKELYKAAFPYAVAGWLMTEKGYTLEQLNELAPFALILLSDEFEKFIDSKINN